MLASALARRRPRPVADAPPLDGRTVAQAWLVELVASAPLDRAAALGGDGFADDAPRLCAAVGAALSSDLALGDLQPGGALAPLASRVRAFAGAGSAADALEAVERLRAVTWSAIAEALDRPQPDQVADLADRLAAVTSTLAVAAIEAQPAADAHPDPREGPLASVLAGADRARSAATADADAKGDDESHGEPPAPGAGEARVEPPAPAPGPGEARVEPPAPAFGGEPPAQPPPLATDAVAAEPLSADPALASVSPFPRDARAASPAVGDRPAVEDATHFGVPRVAPWTAAIERRLARRDDGRPFAVLCVEVADLDRLVASDEGRDVALALEAAETATLAQLRPVDALVRERPGRLWLVAPDTDDEAARALGHRLAAAVAGVSAHRGAPLALAAGIAVCPDDGDDAAALEGRAEEALFAARAAGVRIAGRVD